MINFLENYKITMQKEIDKIEHSIRELKETFGSTDWKDERKMIESASEIWQLESRLKDWREQHKIILDNYGTGL